MGRLPAWARYTATNADGSRYAFEAYPEIEVLPGIRASEGGTRFVEGEPEESWAGPEGTLYQFIEQVEPPADWRATVEEVGRRQAA